MNFFLKIWQIIAPGRLIVFFRFILAPQSYKVRSKAVLDFYKKLDLQKEPAIIQEGIKFLKYHKYTPLPFKWTLKYEKYLPEVFYSEINQRFYVKFDNKNLYYPKHFTKTQVIWATRSILKEQDQQSPHLYLTEQFQVEQ